MRRKSRFIRSGCKDRIPRRSYCSLDAIRPLYSTVASRERVRKLPAPPNNMININYSRVAATANEANFRSSPIKELANSGAL